MNKSSVGLVYLNMWGLEWYSKNTLNGITRHLIFDACLPKLFITRQEARHFAKEKYGYIKVRKDLRNEPHGWRVPRPVKVNEIHYGPYV